MTRSTQRREGTSPRKRTARANRRFVGTNPFSNSTAHVILRACIPLILLCVGLMAWGNGQVLYAETGERRDPSLTLPPLRFASEIYDLPRGGDETNQAIPLQLLAAASITPTETLTPTATKTTAAAPAASATPTRTRTPTFTPVSNAPATPPAVLTKSPPPTVTPTRFTTRTPNPSQKNETNSIPFPFKYFFPLISGGLATGGVRPAPPSLVAGMGIERYWTYQAFQLTDRVTLLVNLWNGNLVAQYNEFSIPSLGLPLALNRTFNHQVNLSSLSGYNWTRNLDYRVVEGQKKGNVYDPDGTQLQFTSPSQGVFASPPGVFDTLMGASNGNTGPYTITHKDQSQHIFGLNNNGTWLLTKIQDRVANTITLSYDAAFRVITTTAAGGHTLVSNYDIQSGKLLTVTNNATQKLTYQYLVDDLSAVTDPLGLTTAFVYNSHKLTTLTDPRTVSTTITYDGSNRVQTITIGGTQVASFSYGNGTTTFTDGNNRATTYTINGTGQVTQMLDPLNGTTGYAYDANYDVTQVTDPLNRISKATYDTKGNALTQTDALTQTTLYTYNVTNDLVSTSDPLSRTTRYGYDGVGNLKVITDALGFTTNYNYNAFGQRTSATDANSNVTQYGYNSLGYMTVLTDALTNVMRYGYDAVGNRTVMTDALGSVTSFTFDADNRLVSTTMPLTGTQTATTSYGYDGVGNRTIITDALTHVTSYAYDALNRQTAITDPLTHITNFGYDPVGNRTVITDANSHVTRYGYDVLNRTTAITDALTNITRYGYDAVGNRTVITDARGNTTTYRYDRVNRVISTTVPLTGTQVATTLFGYDKVGNRTVITDANNNVTRYGYDALNRTSVFTDAVANITKYGYDKVSNQTVITDTLNNTTRYDYDALNRVITTTNPLGKKQTIGYDSVGNALSRTDELTQTTRYAYDQAHRVVALTDPLTQTTQYRYDAVGNTLAITSPMTQVTAFVYDSANRMTSMTTPIGATGYGYDNANNLTTITDPSLATQNFTYDAANRMTQEDDRDASSTLVVSYVYLYDPNGNRTRETESRPGKPDRVTNYEYNKANWLVTNTDAGGSATVYSYDAAGNRTGVSDALGVTTVITPTVQNLPGSTSHYQSGAWKDTTTNTYDPRNNLTGTNTNFTSGFGNFTLGSLSTYNSNNYVSIYTNTVGGTPHDSYSLTYNDNNLVSYMRWDIPVAYDGANRVTCYAPNNLVAPEFWGYYNDGNRLYHRSGYTLGFPCKGDTIPGPANGGRREDYSYTGQELTQRVWGYWDPNDTTTNYMTSTMSYDPAGNLTQEVITNTNPATTTTKSYYWSWQAGAYRMTTFTGTNGVTTTFDYDSAGRISRRYNSLGYSDYSYVDGTDWLVRETWHSYVSGNTFNLYEYWYANGRPSRVTYVSNAPPDLSFVWSYNTQYLQYNWHGDFAVGINLDGVGGGAASYAPWGLNGGNDFPGGQYYQWNGGWGYMGFRELWMHYIHGRWYNPDIGRFISPDEKGEYLYGSGDDAVNWAWIADQSISLGNTSPLGRTIVLGGGGFVRDTAWANYQIFYPPAEWTLLDRLGNTTRGVAPIFLAEGIVTLGPQAVSAGATYLGRTLLGRAITGGASACAADQRDCTNTLNNTAQSVWRLNTLQRGIKIEDMLGRSPQLVQNYPVIDRFENGVVTSIKSIDLSSPSYQNMGLLTRTAQGYVNAIANWQGATWAGFPIQASQITGRQLVLAIPSGASPAQVVALQQVQQWASTVGVNFVVVVVR